MQKNGVKKAILFLCSLNFYQKVYQTKQIKCLSKIFFNFWIHKTKNTTEMMIKTETYKQVNAIPWYQT